MTHGDYRDIIIVLIPALVTIVVELIRRKRRAAGNGSED